MKKTIGIFILLCLITFTGYSMFYNGFSNIQSISIQTYDEPFETGITITKEKEISKVTDILNRANAMSNTEYELASEPEYKVQLMYHGKSTEIIYIKESFDQNNSLLISNKRGYYKISEKQTKKALGILLN